MRHDWDDWWADPRKTPAQVFMSQRERHCRNCGATQHQEIEHSWGRVVGRRWTPLVGRCKGDAAARPK